MDLIDKIKEIANKINKLMNQIATEEATKTAFVMPFLSALGYDVFNPSEVVPEFTADVGTKKGEKVDYAIQKDDHIIILIECKHCLVNLDDTQASQLYRYFSVTEARFGIVTNGILYRFYSDIEEPNKMDTKPFFEFNMLNFNDNDIEQLKKFAKTSFNLENILTTASTLKYTNAIKRLFSQDINNPSEEFVKYFVGQVYSGKRTQPVIEQFTKIVKDALNQFVIEKVNDRLKSALEVERKEAEQQMIQETPETDTEDGIITTEEEIEGYNITKAIAREVVDAKRISLADRKHYCNILLDNSIKKPILRMYFNTSKKYIGLFDKKEGEEKIAISELNDIFAYSKRIKTTVTMYLEAVEKKKDKEKGQEPSIQ